MPDIAARAPNHAPGSQVPSTNFLKLAEDEDFIATSPLPPPAAPVPVAAHVSAGKLTPSEQQKAAGSLAHGMHKASNAKAAPPVNCIRCGSDMMPGEAVNVPAQKTTKEDDHAGGASKLKERHREDSTAPSCER